MHFSVSNSFPHLLHVLMRDRKVFQDSKLSLWDLYDLSLKIQRTSDRVDSGPSSDPITLGDICAITFGGAKVTVEEGVKASAASENRSRVEACEGGWVAAILKSVWYSSSWPEVFCYYFFMPFHQILDTSCSGEGFHSPRDTRVWRWVVEDCSGAAVGCIRLHPTLGHTSPLLPKFYRFNKH